MEAAFRIHPELRDYIRRESEDEKAMLEQSLLFEGCRDPLVVWKEENVLVDGHHRFEICERHGMPYTVKYQSFASVKEAKAWMRKNQLARRNLDKAERDQWIREMREEGMTQKEVAEILNVDRSLVSHIERNVKNSHPGQPSQNLNQDADLALKTRADEAERTCQELKKESERLRVESARATAALREIVFDRNLAREKSRALEKELEALKGAAREKEVVEVEVKVVDASITAAKVAELEKAKMEAETARLQLDKEREQLERARERDAAHVDLKGLEDECRLLESKKRGIEAEIKAASIVEKIQRRLREEHDAFTHGAAVLQIITQEIIERDDCAGLSVEELEQLEWDIARVGVCVKELIPAVHALIEKIKNGGALRIV